MPDPSETKLRRAVEFLGLRRSMAGLLGMAILVGLGEKMAERYLPIYIGALGGSFYAVGALNGLDNLLSALYSFPGGWLSERLGAKRALLVFNLLAMAGYVVLILVPSVYAVMIGSVLFLSWTAISLPSAMDLVAKVLPKEKRTMGVSLHSLVRRIPMALGPVLGGVFVQQWGKVEGIRVAFMVALALAAVAVVLQQALIEDDAPVAAPPVADVGLRASLALLTPPLRKLLVSDILIRFCEQIPYAFLAIWCLETVAHPITPRQFGLLTAIEMTTAIFVYIPVAYLADRAGKKPIVLITFVNFTVFPLVLLWSHSFWPLLAAFIVRGLKEFGEPTRKALILDLAPEGRKAATFGVYYLARDVVVSVAAFSGGWLWTLGPSVNLYTAAAFGALGTIWFALFGEDMPAPAQGGRDSSAQGA